MKVVKTVLIAFLVQTLNLVAEVTFDFNYSDAPGTGFNARPKAKEALEEVSVTIGKHWLKNHNANIKIKVTSEDNLDLASDSFYVSLANTSKKSLLYSSQAKIFGEKIQELDPDSFDGHIHINFASPFSFDDNVNENEYDFKSLMMQKITQILGFGSLTLFNDQFMQTIKEEFIKKLFIYGYNEVSNKPQDINLIEILNTLDFFNSQDIDVEKLIWENISSSLDKAFAKLLTEFINYIKNDTILDNTITNEFSKQLAKQDLAIEDIINFAYDERNEFITKKLKVFQEKISNKDSNDLNEKELPCDTLIDGDVYFEKFKGILDEILLEKSFLEDLEKIHNFISNFFANEYLRPKNIFLNNETMDKLLNLIKTGAASSYEELLDLLGLAQDQSQKLGRTLFDQFIVYETGHKVYGRKKILKSLIADFNKHIKEDHFYFKGDISLKYLDYPIMLEKKSLTYIADKNSIMSYFYAQKGLRPRIWDESVTAILMDLGYNVNNRWSRLWKSQDAHKEGDTRKFEQKPVQTFVENLKQKVKKDWDKVKNKVKKKAKKIEKKLKDLL